VNCRPLFMGVTPHTSSGEPCTRRLSPTFLINLQMIYKVTSDVSVDSIKKVAGELCPYGCFSTLSGGSKRRFNGRTEHWSNSHCETWKIGLIIILRQSEMPAIQNRDRGRVLWLECLY